MSKKKQPVAAPNPINENPYLKELLGLERKGVSESSGQTQGIYVPGGLDKYTRDISPNDIAYIDDYRGERQSTAEKWGNGLVKFVGKTGLRVVDAFATIPYVLGAGLLQDGEQSYLESIYNNPISTSIGDMMEEMNKALPNYYTQEEQDSLVTSLTSANFWADKFLDGASYAASAYISGMGVSKGITGLRSVFGNLGKGAGLLESATTLDDAILAARQLEKTSGLPRKIGDFFQQGASTIFASGFESSNEARETYNTVKDKLIQDRLNEKQSIGDNSYLSEEELQEIEEKAVSAGNINFGMNMLLTGAANTLQFGKYFSNAKYSNTAINRNRIIGGLGESSVADPTKSQKFFNRFKPIYDNVISEAGQEVGQLASNELLVDYYTAKNQDSEQLSKSFLEAMHKSFLTKEGWESALLGAFIGGGTMLGGKIANKYSGNLTESQQKEKSLNEAVQIRNALPQQINNYIGNGLRNLNTSSEITKQQMEAAKNGDKFSYLGLAALDLHNMVSGAIESNSYEDYIATLESAKDLSEEQFKEQFGVTSLANKNEFIDEMIDKSNKLEQSYSKIKNVFGHKLNNEQIGVVSTVAAIADDAALRQNQIFEKLKNEYGFDLREQIFNQSVGFNRDFNILNNLNRELNTQKSKKDTLQTTSKTNPNFKSEMRIINNEINRLSNDIESLTFEENQIVDEQNYRERINQLSVQTKNKLSEKAKRGAINEILNPTNREEFESLLNDFETLENVKSSFIKTYNDLTSKNYQKNFDNLSKKIQERLDKNETDSLFTIEVPNVETSLDENGVTQENITSQNLILNPGVYTGNVTSDTYLLDGETNKVETPNNIYEIKQRRVRQTSTGNNIPEVLVSINGEKDKWVSVSKLKFKKIQPVQNNELSAEQVFYNKYKDRLITIQYSEGYSDEELNKILQNNQNIIRDNQERINNGEDVNLNDGIIVGAKRNSDGTVKMRTESGFLGLDRNGRPTFRIWNEQSKSFEAIRDRYLTDLDENGNQRLSIFSFKVSQDEQSESGYYQPSVNYTRIASKRMSDRYLMSRFIDNRIEELEEELNDLLSDEKTESVKSLRKDLRSVSMKIQNAKRNYARTIDNKSKLLVLNKLITDLNNEKDKLNEKLEQKQEALKLIKQELSLLNSQKNQQFTESKLIQAVNNAGIPLKLNAQLIVDRIESKYQSQLNVIESLDNASKTLSSNIAQTLLDNYGSDIDNMLQEGGLDPSNMSDADKLDYITSDLNLTLETLTIDDLQIQSELIDLNDMVAHMNQFEQQIKDEFNQEIENQLGFPYSFDSLQQLRDYADRKGIDINLTDPINPLSAQEQLERAALESELEAFKEIKKSAFYDQRLENKGKRSHTIRSEEYTEDTIETSDLDDFVTELDNTAPSVYHNGNFTLPGMEHVPFMKTTNPNVETVEDSDDNTKKSKFIFNNAVTLLDTKKYFVEITDTLADEQGGDSNKYPVSDKAKGSLYTIIVDEHGNRIKFNLTGAIDPNGLIAHAVLPTESLQTKSDTGEINNRFHDYEFLTDFEKDAIKKSQEEYLKLRDSLTNKLSKGERVFYNINSKSLGVRKTSNIPNRLNEVINYDFKNPSERFIFGTGLTEDIGDGDKYKTFPGKIYYVNEETKQTVPLKTRKINENEINNIINALVYFDNNNTPEASQDEIINAISTYLLWGAKPKLGNVAYEIYFTPDTNATQLTFSGFYKTEEGKKKKISKIINISDLNGNTQARKDLTDFLSGINKQVYTNKLGRAIDRRKNSEIPNNYKVRQFTENNFTDVEYSDYFNYVVESDESSLSTNMIKNSNSKSGIIKPQWVGAYLRLGDEIPVGKKLTKNSVIAQEPKMTDFTSDAYKKAAERIKSRHGINVERLTGIIANDAYGMFLQSGKVLLSDEAPVGTDYHEEFHIVEDLYLTTDEKNKIYNQWRKLNNENATDSEVSEALAEEFRYYSLNRDLQNSKLKGTAIERFIQSLLNFIERLTTLSNSKDINDLFDAIYDGKLTIEQKTSGSKFSPFQQYQLNKSLNAALLQNNITNATKEEFIESVNNLENSDLKNKVLNDIDSVYNYYKNDNSNENILNRVFNGVIDTDNQNVSINNILGLPTNINDKKRTDLRKDLQGSTSIENSIDKLKTIGTPIHLKVANTLEQLNEQEQNDFLSIVQDIYVEGEGFVSGLNEMYNKLQRYNLENNTNARISSSLEAGIPYKNHSIVGLSNLSLNKNTVVINYTQYLIDRYSDQERLRLDDKPYENIDLSDLTTLFGEDVVSEIKNKVDYKVLYGDNYDFKSDSLSNLIDDISLSENDVIRLNDKMRFDKLNKIELNQPVILSSFEKEKLEIRRKALEDGNYQTAPNGNPSNLTGEQWETVRTKSFKNWFGDWINDPENSSKVVDENGEPMIVSHSTNNRFDEFDISKFGETDEGYHGKGFYFSKVRKKPDGTIVPYANYGKIKMFNFLNIRNPLTKGNSFNIGRNNNTSDNDGVFSSNLNDFSVEIIALNSNQIKSATNNTGTFSNYTNNIYDNLKKPKQINEQLLNKLQIDNIPNVSTENLLSYVIQNKTENNINVLEKNVFDKISKIKEKTDNYFLNSLNNNLTLNNDIDSRELQLSIDELYSYDSQLVLDILEVNTSKNGNIYQYVSDQINDEFFGLFEIDNFDISGLEDLVALNNKNNINNYDNPNFDETYGIVNNELYKRLGNNEYVKLEFVNPNFNNYSKYNIKYVDNPIEILEDQATRLNKINTEQGNC